MSYLTDYYRAVKNPAFSCRYDIENSTWSHRELENMLANKAPNKGGPSFYTSFQFPKSQVDLSRKTDGRITTGKISISAVFIPDPAVGIGFGDIQTTEDAIIFNISSDWTVIELFISRGQKNNKQSLYQLASDGELDDEMNRLRDLCKKN